MSAAPAAARAPDSRERLLAAAARSFCARGYAAVPVEEIAAEAGVSRMTLYRHFGGKAALAEALFARSTAVAMPRLLAIGTAVPLDETAVAAWLAELFASDRAHRQMLRVFTQASVAEPGFTARAHGFIDAVIEGLGRSIPAFAIERTGIEGRRRWIAAWLLVYEILDQSNHAALGSGVATDPLVIDVLAARFLRFVHEPG